MRLFPTAFDKERLALRYAVYRDDELLMTCSMLDDARATVDRYANNVEHAKALMNVQDTYSDSASAAVVVYAKRGTQVVTPLKEGMPS